MKRNLIMDVLHKDRKEPIGEWHDVKEEPQEDKDKLWVKCRNEDECFAYYYRDRGIFTSPYTLYPEKQMTCFWHSSEHIPIQDVTHWKYLAE